jgi:hypothetical protein
MKVVQADRYWARVDKKNGPIPAHKPRLGRCHIWTGSKNPGGYGHLKVAGKTRTAHTVGFELQNGPIPEGAFVLHKCDNRPCVRGSHLFTGTQKDNVLDAVKKGRHKNPVMPGEAHPLARLTGAQVAEMRKAAADGEPKASLEERFKVTRRHLNRVLSGEQWKGPEHGNVLLRNYKVKDDDKAQG